MLLWIRQLQIAVSQVLGISCCKVLDDESCICYQSFAMRDVWHLHMTTDMQLVKPVQQAPHPHKAEGFVVKYSPDGVCL